MSYEAVKAYLSEKGMAGRLSVHETACDTVAHAAEQIGCCEAQIAKTMSFLLNDGPIVIVCTGDVKISNPKYKAFFGQKARMVPWDEVTAVIGHEPGGVCPFAPAEGVRVFLDESLKRFELVHAAGGRPDATVRLAPSEFEGLCPGARWVDVTQPIMQAE